MKFTPSSLFGRFLLIIMLPMVLLQVVITIIFYERHWENVTSHMQDALVGEVETVLNTINSTKSNNKKALNILSPLGLEVKFLTKETFLQNKNKFSSKQFDQDLSEFKTKLEKLKTQPNYISYISNKSSIVIGYKIKEKHIEISFSSKRIKSPTTYIFMLWMIGVASLLIIISLIFMRNQIRSITKLAEVADQFGKGHDIELFKPSGAKEIRTAGNAFIKMKQRIERQIKYRTELLAHISHDLRTPLTRLKLQTAMLDDKGVAEEISQDLNEMEQMVISYLDFAKGEGNEEVVETEIIALLNKTLAKFNDARLVINTSVNMQHMPLRPNAFQRAINNIIENAIKYAKSKIEVIVYKLDDNLYITVDDDGKGIEEQDRKMVFKPFQKTSNSKEGYGLGLAIVKSVVQAHGGKIKLAQSPYNGLRIILIFPI
ncbi:Signal transduction histidine kinase [Candidatus Jidaibacter acanthamoeba]|uniref:Putative sensor histidine kinase NtrY-like n=1 Tax=Candidatus Jidaibacter acanthamoebae TaxID=86105 RepID=A0A0C1MQB2_9RICK|nr:ATP-binding protein [Candidatus Jidaibacter acanthamoeba]KIE04152.1 Signal transduction histidine kinase [Candidatus Jidaibacter acanthamoeba]